MESLRSLIRAITIHENEILKMCDHNTFSLSFIIIQINQIMNDNKDIDINNDDMIEE